LQFNTTQRTIAVHMKDFSITRGVIFDLDGTLVDSGLDFDQIRTELGLPDGQPILEAIATMSPDEAARCHKILRRHEREGAMRSRVMPAADQFIEQLRSGDVLVGVATRNSRETALATVARHKLNVHTLIAREDAQPKPHPAALLSICNDWQLSPDEVVMVGDFRFDLEAGRRAGMRTVFYTGGRAVDAETSAMADFVLDSFADVDVLLTWLGIAD
jgi:HAD superfamily hydrolase (TIGR01509 family)